MEVMRLNFTKMGLSVLCIMTFLVVVEAQLGPGSGKWEVVTPESQGLSTKALTIAEGEVSVPSETLSRHAPLGVTSHECDPTKLYGCT
jgi:hypothetical protein